MYGGYPGQYDQQMQNPQGLPPPFMHPAAMQQAMLMQQQAGMAMGGGQMTPQMMMHRQQQMQQQQMQQQQQFQQQQQQQQQPEQQPFQSKFQRIAALRQESHETLRKKQVAQLDLSPSLAGQRVTDAHAAVMSGPPEVYNASSFEDLPNAPRAYMHAVMGTTEASCIESSGKKEGWERAAEELEQAAREVEAGWPEERCVESKIGQFVCRPGDIDLVAKKS